MSLTRIGSIGINTGIAFAGVTTIVTLNTANDALSIGATVNIGSGNLTVGSGVTVSSDGDVFFTGIATGDASGLTALNASALGSGTVPPTRLAGPYTNAIAGSATNATNFYVTANNSTDETVYPIFVDGATGNQGAETDTGLTYNPSTGNLTATKFTGDGSSLTNITSTTINSNTNNYLITGTGTANTLQGESGLTYDGSSLDIFDSSNSQSVIKLKRHASTASEQAHIGYFSSGLHIETREATYIALKTNTSEALRVDSGGRLLLGTTTEGHAAADDLTIENTAADMGLTLRSGTSNQGAIYFSDGTSGDDEYRGIINYNHANDALSVYTNATEKIRIATDGRITVGTTVVGHGDADALTIATTGGYTGITLRSDTDQGGAIYFSDATSGTAQYDGFFYYNQNLRKMVFGTAQTNAMSIDSSGNIDAVIGNIVMATSGKGISFAATGGPNNGSGTSELLDDYEEGTFTPAYAMSSGGHSITYATQQGNYTKIGDTVSIEIYITINGINANGSGSLYVTGLPFTKTGRYGGMNISYPHGLNNTEITHALVDVNSTNLYLYNFDGSSVTNATVAGSFTVNTQMMFNGTYLAA